MINFRVDGRSGVPPYLQIVQQVRQALRMGVLTVGDQLPTVREVVAEVAVNPNTVLKAYRDLEREGLIEARARHCPFLPGRPAARLLSSAARRARTRRSWPTSATSPRRSRCTGGFRQRTTSAPAAT